MRKKQTSGLKVYLSILFLIFINSMNRNLFGGFALAKLQLFKLQSQKVAHFKLLKDFIFQ